MSDHQSESASHLLALQNAAKLLAHPKWRVIQNRLSPMNEEATVTEIIDTFGGSFTQPEVSQFLAKGRRVGFLHAERHGKWMIYRLNHARIFQVVEFAREFGQAA